MQQTAHFDKLVGHVAGAIYTDINSQFPQPPLMMVPSVTFKVKKVLEQITDLRLLTELQKAELAKDIQVSLVPLLFSLEIDAEVIEKISPMIEAAAFKALVSASE